MQAKRAAPVALLGACALSISAVACGDAFAPETGTYRGRYVSAFEASAFTACGSGTSWWTMFEARHPTLDSALAATSIEDVTELYLVVRGHLSPPGRYGHLGASIRELRVREILEVRAWDASACR